MTTSWFRRRVVLQAVMMLVVVTCSLPVGGGSLTPPGTPGPTMATLDEIKTAVDDNGTAIGAVDTKVVAVETKVVGLQSSVSSVSSKVDDVQVEVENLAGTSSASMLPTALASDFFTHARVIGANQGPISDEANSSGSLGPLAQGIPAYLRDRITVVNFENTLTKRVNSGGVPTGGAIIESSKILKYIDRSSPLLLTALKSNETLDIDVEHYRANASSGTIDLYYTHQFHDCKLLAVRHVGPNLEEIEFYYPGVSATHQLAGTTGSVP